MKKIYKLLSTMFMILIFATACTKNEELNESEEENISKYAPNQELENVIEIFDNNQEIFWELQEYYSNLDYESILKNVGDTKKKKIDGVEYEVGIYEDGYKILCFDTYQQKGYKGYENLPESVLKIRELIDTYQGFVLRIDASTYELVDIEINVSNHKEAFLMCIIWGKTEADKEDCNVELIDNWGMYMDYYKGI